MLMLRSPWRNLSSAGTLSVRLRLPSTNSRALLTLAIETSCDDTSVAILEKHGVSRKPSATLHFNKKVTADNIDFGGIHPLVALRSHQTNLANLVHEALQCLPNLDGALGGIAGQVAVRSKDGEQHLKRKPDFITVTRGPGMYSSLSTGIDTAKGLAIAWSIPLLGVHHMQAHALTPRLVTALEAAPDLFQKCEFPFLSLLVSGGHTLLLHSKDLTNHAILTSTIDVAIGDYIDKCARHILPASLLKESGEIMYGRLLEQYVFPCGSDDYEYTAPARSFSRDVTSWGWGLSPPLVESRSGSKVRAGSTSKMKFSFAGLGGVVSKICEKKGEKMEEQERKDLGRHGMKVAFEHLSSRVVMALEERGTQGTAGIDDANDTNTLVLSGGVAANGYLKAILRSFLDVRGFKHVKMVFPPPSLCTDNAAMIAWTGIEMFESGWESELSFGAIRSWSLDPAASDGGILGLDGWRKR